MILGIFSFLLGIAPIAKIQHVEHKLIRSWTMLVIFQGLGYGLIGIRALGYEYALFLGTFFSILSIAMVSSVVSQLYGKKGKFIELAVGLSTFGVAINLFINVSWFISLVVNIIYFSIFLTLSICMVKLYIRKKESGILSLTIAIVTALITIVIRLFYIRNAETLVFMGAAEIELNWYSLIPHIVIILFTGMSKTLYILDLSYLSLKRQADYDQLTQIMNRNCFEKTIASWISENQDQHYSIIVVDVDQFKEFNDSYGHDVGDRILVKVAHTLQKEIDTGFVGRYGGDEFVVFIPGNIDYAFAFDYRVLKSIDSISIDNNDLKKTISISTGIANAKANIKYSEVFKIADKLMYEGRKRRKAI